MKLLSLLPLGLLAAPLIACASSNTTASSASSDSAAAAPVQKAAKKSSSGINVSSLEGDDIAERLFRFSTSALAMIRDTDSVEEFDAAMKAYCSTQSRNLDRLQYDLNTLDEEETAALMEQLEERSEPLEDEVEEIFESKDISSTEFLEAMNQCAPKPKDFDD